MHDHHHGSVTQLVSQLTAELHARGARMTGPREVVLTVLADAPGHLTADQVVERVAEVDPTVHPSSVHRTLGLLVELGLVQSVHLGHGARVHHLVGRHAHGHGHCRSCGRVVDLSPALMDRVAELAAGEGFVLDAHDVALSGWCAECSHPSRQSS